MHLLMLPRYSRQGASSRYRSFQYLSYFEKAGITPHIAPLLDGDYLNNRYQGRGTNLKRIASAYASRVATLIAKPRSDVVWIEKEAFPWLPAGIEHLFLRMGVPYVVDYDDAIFHRYDRHDRTAVRAMLGLKIDSVMRHAALVVAGNNYLAERAQQAGASRIEVVPTVVDLDRYVLTPEPDERVFTVGWIGSPTTTPYLTSLLPTLHQLAQEAPLKVLAIGAAPLAYPGLDIEVVPWSETTEVADMQRCHVGIMPLADSPWERGKCGLKLIQYMACGRPVIGSPVGVNRDIIDHGVQGFHASTEREWLAALRALRDNPKLALCQGQAGRSRVEERYCLQVTAPRLASLLHAVARP